jgi:hypothetical protein
MFNGGDGSPVADVKDSTVSSLALYISLHSNKAWEPTSLWHREIAVTPVHVQAGQKMPGTLSSFQIARP